MADRMQLLNDVRDHTINNDGVNGANSLHSPGRSGSIVGKFSSPLAPTIDELSVAFDNSSLATPNNTPHVLRDWSHSSPLNPMHRGAFNTGIKGYTDHHMLSPNQAKHQETLR